MVITPKPYKSLFICACRSLSSVRDSTVEIIFLIIILIHIERNVVPVGYSVTYSYKLWNIVLYSKKTVIDYKRIDYRQQIKSIYIYIYKILCNNYIQREV